MMNAEEAKRKSLGVDELFDKCEEKIEETVENGDATGTVILGATDIASKEGIRMVQEELEDMGYDVVYDGGVNMHITWA